MTLVEAVRRAAETRARLGVRGVATAEDAARAVADAGVERWPDAPMPGRVYGAYCDGVIEVRRGLLPGTALFVLVHELGHAALGHASGAYRSPLLGGGPEASAAEAEAQVYAYVFLLGPPATTLAGLDRQLHAGCAAGLPLGFLLGCAALFGQALL